MVQFLSINFFCWISSIFVGFFKSSRFFCVSLYIINLWAFIALVESVYCAVRTDSLHKADYVSSLKG